MPPDRFGRIPILITALTLFCLSSVLCAVTTNLDNFLALRLLQGLGGGGGPVISRAIVRDLYGMDKAPRMLAMIQSVVVTAPVVAPIVGGYVLLWFGWRSIFWLLVAYGVLCLTIFVVIVRETHTQRQTTSIAHAFFAYGRLLRDKRYLGFALTSAFVFAGLFAFVAGSAFVTIELFGVAPHHFGFLFGLAACALIVGAWLNSRLVMRLGFRKMLAVGSTISAFAGVLIYTAAQFEIGGLFGLYVPICCALGAVALISPNAAAGAMQHHSERAGAASALLSAVQFGVGALGAFLVGWLHDGSAMPLATVMLTSGMLAFAAQRWLIID